MWLITFDWTCFGPSLAFSGLNGSAGVIERLKFGLITIVSGHDLRPNFFGSTRQSAEDLNLLFS